MGGTINAEGGDNGAGIGGGDEADGGNITINGGTVWAYSRDGAGIGGGQGRERKDLDPTWESGDGGTITINGGTVRADSTIAYGIGAGSSATHDEDPRLYNEDEDIHYMGSVGNILIGGDAVVYANGMEAAIGGDTGTIQITGGTVTLGEEHYERHGGGIWILDEGTLTISGGTVIANGRDDHPGVAVGYLWDGGKFVMTGGKLTATSEKRVGIYAGTCEFSQGITVETYSGGKGKDDDYVDYNIYYPGAKVTAGKNKIEAELVTLQSNREGAYKKNDYKYILIEPCDPHQYGEDNRCALCGDQKRPIRYIERSWDGSKVVSTAKDVPATAGRIPSNLSGEPSLSGGGGWYLVDRDIKVDGRLCFTGDANLILYDGYTLDVKGMYIPAGYTLNIYGQSQNAGRIVSRPSSGAGIGGKSGNDYGNIVIHGGTIDVEGASHCAGLGTNDGRYGSSITVYGGKIIAEGGDDGAGIGGTSFTIYGGEITAEGGKNGAGIGGGKNCSGGSITIYDGTINAEGGDNGAGIGGGQKGNAGLIAIFGGDITAKGGDDAAGIGCGEEASGGRITIYDGDNIAEGGDDGACIGGGSEGNCTIDIEGGNVNAVNPSENGAAIGGGEKGDGGEIRIMGGEVHALPEDGSKGCGAAIGGGNLGGNGGTITITGGTV